MIIMRGEGEWKVKLALWVLAQWAWCCRVTRRVDRRVCKIAHERRMIAITAATATAIFVTIRWQGIGGIIIANMANWAKDAGEIIIDIEIFGEEG